MKPIATKLKIYKNTIPDTDNHFTYKYEWLSADGTVLSTNTYKIQPTDMGIPDESRVVLSDLYEHKNHCCLQIDPNTIEIEEILV